MLDSEVVELKVPVCPEQIDTALFTIVTAGNALTVSVIGQVVPERLVPVTITLY